MDTERLKNYDFIKNLILSTNIDEIEIVELYKLVIKHLKEIG